MEVRFEAIELGEPTLGEAPEGFNAIDVYTLAGEVLAFMDAQMLIIADVDQAVLAAPALGDHHALHADASANGLLQAGSGYIGDDFRVDPPLPFKYAEDRLLMRSSSPPGTLPTAQPAGAEIALIHFHGADKRLHFPHLPLVNRRPEQAIIAVDGLAVQTQQLGRLACIDVETKASNYFRHPVLA